MLKLVRWLYPPKPVRLVDGGRVACPVRNEMVDTDGCIGCVHLRTVTLDEDRALAGIVCDPPRHALPGYRDAYISMGGL